MFSSGSHRQRRNGTKSLIGKMVCFITDMCAHGCPPNVRLTTRIVLDHASYNSVVMWLTFISLVSERAAPKHMRGTVRQKL